MALTTRSEWTNERARIENYLGDAISWTKKLFLAMNEGLFGGVFKDCDPTDELWFLHGLNFQSCCYHWRTVEIGLLEKHSSLHTCTERS
jgi:hypothetical protein